VAKEEDFKANFKISLTKQGLVYFCFFLSGATGLIYQVLWARLLGLVFGNTMYAISLVLATFMAGLALGSYLVGKVIKRYPHPLRAYDVMELGIGLWAILIPFLLKGVDYLYITLFPVPGSSLLFSSLLRFGLSSLVLLIPTILMGGTLPVLTTYLTPHLQQLGGKLSFLYALNTLGAVGGTWWVGFYALPWLGMDLTNLLAVLINIAIGFLFLLLKQPTGILTSEAHPGSVSPSNKVTYFLLGGMLAAGFSAMIYEIAWTRTLIMVLGSSTYAFSCILMAFLLGIALGSFIFNLMRERITFTLKGFCIIQVLIGTFSLLSLPAFSYLPRAYLILYRLLPSGAWPIQGLRFLIPISIMTIPATLMGLAFPLAGELYAQQTGEITSGVGNIYGANTLGNVCGAVLTGFVLLSGVGVQNSLKLAIMLNLSIGAAGILIRKSRVTALLIGASILIGGLTLFQPPWDRYLLDSAVSLYTERLDPLQLSKKWMHQNKIIYYKEGINGIVTVYQVPSGNRFLRVNGKTDASNADLDMPTQLLLGYVPLFLHPNPHNALVIGLGSGITVGAVAQYDFIRQVDCVEIEPAVVEAAKFFKVENQEIHQNPKVRFIVEDGRTYQKRPYQSYDLIISEPPNPWMKGVANLFSTDFYQLCRRSLKAKGVMCQWIHCYRLSPEVFKMVLNSFRQSFPYCQLWFIPQGNDALIIGSEHPIIFDLERMAQLINYKPNIKKEMKNKLAVDSPTSFLAYFLLNNEGMAGFTKGASLNTDNYPRLEFLAADDRVSISSSPLISRIIKTYKNPGPPQNIKPNNRPISFAEYYYGLSRVYLMGKNIGDAYQFINGAIKYNDQDPRFFLVRGRIFDVEKKLRPALADFERSLELDPNNYEPYLELAYIYESQQSWDQAQQYYRKAMELAPYDHKLLFSYAYFVFSRGKFEQALSVVLKLTPSSEVGVFKVWELTGDIYSRMSKFDLAGDAYEKSYRNNPANYMVRIKLGELDLMQGKVKEALEKFEASRDMLEYYQPEDVKLLFMIADCYLRLKQHDNAVKVYRDILRKDPGNYEAYQRLNSLPKG
jgi:spermidine synthase